MYKLITTEPGYFGDEPIVTPVNLHDKFMTKLASENEKIAKFVGNLKPREDGIYLHINALGGEHWSSNNNGDFFESEVLAYECPMESGIHRMQDYGHKTFEKYAYPYKHHKNDDPNKSVGEKVKFASYNPRMDRVELVVFIDRNKDPELCKQAENGEAVPVSMGCFIAGTNVVLPDYSVVPIETLDVGDRVLTMDGSAQKITELHKRPYSGKFYTIKGANVPGFTCTEEHPILSVKKKDVYKVYPKANDRYQHGKFDKSMLKWIHAKCIEEGDLLAFPINKDIYTPDYASKSLARFLGYYLAEGHILKNKKGEYVGVEFSAHIDDSIRDEIEQLCSDIGAVNKPVIRERGSSDKCLSIALHDKRIADLCSVLCGMYAKSKCIDESLMLWDPELQLEFLGAYINGDGCVNRGKWQPGSITISTSSESISRQIQVMCMRCGIVTGLNYIRHRSGGFNHHETLEYQIYICKTHAYKLSGVSSKAKDLIPSNAKKSVKYLEDGYLLIPISSISIDKDECDVYNFEVENNESYVVEYATVHNCKVLYDVCSICGNAAKKKENYCEHLKYAMNQVLPDGRKVYAINKYPRFFDISFVLRPAEKASYVMKKVASSNIVVPSAFIADALQIEEPKISEDKSAEMKKEIPIDEVKTEQPKQDVIKAYSGLIPKICSLEPSMSDEDLKGLSEFPLKDILSSISGLGMVLQPREFQKIVVIKSSGGDKELKPEISSDDINGDVLSLIRKYVVDRSSYRPAVRMRIVKLASQKPAVNEDQTLQQDLVSKGLPTLAIISGLYDLYRTQLGKKNSSFLMDALKKQPVLTTLLGGAGAAGLGVVANQFEKQAGLRDLTPLKAVGALTYPYFVQAYQEEKFRKTGKKPGGIGMQFVKHPGLIGLASLYGASKLLKKASEDASISDRLRENDAITWPLVEEAPDDMVDAAIINGFINV